MTLQVIKGGFYLGRANMNLSSVLNSVLVNAASEKVAFIFRAPKDGTLAKVGWGTATVTTGADIDVRLESLTVGGRNPSGTLLAAGSNGIQTVLDADDNKWFETAITTPPTVSRGDIMAVVLEMEAASPGSLTIVAGQGGDPNWQFPYTLQALPTYAAVGLQCNFSLEYGDGTIEVVLGARADVGADQPSYNNASTPDERALKFKLPIPVRLVGVLINIDLDGDADLVLQTDGGSILETLSLDADQDLGTAQGYHHIQFQTAHVIAADAFHRISFKPTTVTSVKLGASVAGTAATLDAQHGGKDFFFSERTDAGAWTDDTAKVPWITLICDAFEDGGGAAQLVGGGLVS